ncbi:hypothetical protein [Paucilactobacillus wasatchensis]|uniref:Integral membrane protein n=1 Tax=Paucilactobacillus wasatchensis TaxID=1335616 RepID=A0A0D1A7K9_9LACO|nr:hypothetical protein [Paucilactobacillus wasatchensis]KIS03652.1 hypothetical protein WDC_0731 [Paucilactobacillus wasatchensis]
MDYSSRNKIINGLSYLSILFLPVIFPLIVWIIGGRQADIRHHAIRAFWTQLIPAILGIGLVIVGAFYGFVTSDVQSTSWLLIGMFAIFCLISVILFLYNIVKAIQVFIA